MIFVRTSGLGFMASWPPLRERRLWDAAQRAPELSVSWPRSPRPLQFPAKSQFVQSKCQINFCLCQIFSEKVQFNFSLRFEVKLGVFSLAIWVVRFRVHSIASSSILQRHFLGCFLRMLIFGKFPDHFSYTFSCSCFIIFQSCLPSFHHSGQFCLPLWDFLFNSIRLRGGELGCCLFGNVLDPVTETGRFKNRRCEELTFGFSSRLLFSAAFCVGFCLENQKDIRGCLLTLLFSLPCWWERNEDLSGIDHKTRSQDVAALTDCYKVLAESHGHQLRSDILRETTELQHQQWHYGCILVHISLSSS